MSSHRADTSTDSSPTRRSRAVRLGAVLLAVVGVTAAATSAGFTNDAWFAGSASSAGIQLQGKLHSAAEYSDADDATAAITIPDSEFANMLPEESRTVTLDLRNASTLPVDISSRDIATGDLLDDKSGTTVKIDVADSTLAVDATTTATVTVTAGDWAQGLQDNKTGNSLTVVFTGTPTGK